ncbi:histidinol-phosphate aminotransferase [Rhodothalassium salexigens DSM 2132]|uniref:Histidinol-phosphate aminotransferase n=1 Tax=Rhodothalassium salexigens DSM 2132 TaxID=1188247 RepID=A0A4R2PUK3_RHOSA|nr:histidinol-phosphate transaminase [Rhodothalassium salexigens]MBB4210618.1 histidinol-phosphate aminotransferase [Rhodothalassium salexigens DSM 2132]MBK1639068.1 histidinol-phosphate transaminase [Rhodothalassium salexigens DSM 2132]TCP37825.1 histidinol-phosphate aminotransferase [Rhodothalassium salexigens DSM 2132]
MFDVRAVPQTRPQMRPGIERITPYKPGESQLPGHDRVIKLASNESALGASPRAIEAAQAALADAALYPDGGCAALRAALAEHHGVAADQLVCGAGSEQLLSLLVRAYAGPGDEVLQSQHAFMVYRIAADAQGAHNVFAPERDARVDVDALLDRVTEKTRLVFVANPGNPTGTWIGRRALRRLRAGLPARVLLVIDGAYADYPDDPEFSDGHDLVAEAIAAQADNVVVTRTFSKAYGLAGLRVGYLYGPPSVVEPLNRIREVFNVTAPSQAAALAALADQAHLAQTLAHNRREIDRLGAFLADRGYKTSPSGANFLLVHFDTAERAQAADAHLREQGIIVRPVAGYGLPQCLRVTVGAEADNDAFMTALDAF